MSVAVKAGYVSNAKLRKEYERRHKLGWINCELLAIRLEWFRRDGRPDTSRVLRKLGMSTSYNLQGGPHKQTMIRPRTALELAEAIGVDPHEVGL